MKKLFDKENKLPVFDKCTIVEEGMVLHASKFTGVGNITIRGIVHSVVDVDGNVAIDSSGTWNGNIICNNCTIHGIVNGDINVSGDLHISEYGSVTGDIKCARLRIDYGGKLVGSCNKFV